MAFNTHISSRDALYMLLGHRETGKPANFIKRVPRTSVLMLVLMVLLCDGSATCKVSEIINNNGSSTFAKNNSNGSMIHTREREKKKKRKKKIIMPSERM